MKQFLSDDCIYFDVPVGPVAAARGPEDIVKRIKIALEPLESYENFPGLLVDNGTLDPAPLLDRLRDGRIKWLFFRKDLSDHLESSTRYGNCWPMQVIDALPRYYELVEKRNGLWVYRHRSYQAAAVRRVEDGADRRSSCEAAKCLFFLAAAR